MSKQLREILCDFLEATEIWESEIEGSPKENDLNVLDSIYDSTENELLQFFTSPLTPPVEAKNPLDKGFQAIASHQDQGNVITKPPYYELDHGSVGSHETSTSESSLEVDKGTLSND